MGRPGCTAREADEAIERVREIITSQSPFQAGQQLTSDLKIRDIVLHCHIYISSLVKSLNLGIFVCRQNADFLYANSKSWTK
jgi:hypothetical protein